MTSTRTESSYATVEAFNAGWGSEVFFRNSCMAWISQERPEIGDAFEELVQWIMDQAEWVTPADSRDDPKEVEKSESKDWWREYLLLERIELVDFWRKGYAGRETAERIGLSPGTVQNVTTMLRNQIAKDQGEEPAREIIPGHRW